MNYFEDAMAMEPALARIWAISEFAQQVANECAQQKIWKQKRAAVTLATAASASLDEEANYQTVLWCMARAHELRGKPTPIESATPRPLI